MQFLLNTPSIASCGHDPSYRVGSQRKICSIIQISHRKLPRHDQLDRLLYWFRMRVPGIHESHCCPARLDNLCIFVFNPTTTFTSLRTEHMTSGYDSASVEHGKGVADLVTFSPTSIFSLFRKQKIACTSDSRAVRVVLPAEC